MSSFLNECLLLSLRARRKAAAPGELYSPQSCLSNSHRERVCMKQREAPGSPGPGEPPESCSASFSSPELTSHNPSPLPGILPHLPYPSRPVVLPVGFLTSSERPSLIIPFKTNVPPQPPLSITLCNSPLFISYQHFP